MDDGLRDRIRNALVKRRADQFRFLARLVGMKTENPPTDCASDAERIGELLRDLGLEVETFAVPQDRCFEYGVASATNLIVRHRFGPGPILALQAHGDVVPPGGGWTKDPFGSEIERGVMYGRGTSLAKSSIAAYTYALLALKDAGEPLPGAVEMHITFDGTSGGYVGPAWLLEQRMVAPDAVISAGYTYAVVTQHKGCLQLSVDLRASGTGTPDNRDALQAAHEVLGTLYALSRDYLKIRPRMFGVGAPAIVVGMIDGGRRPNLRPESITVRLGRYFLPEEDPKRIQRQLSTLIGKAVMTQKGVTCNVRPIHVDPPLRPVDGTERLARIVETHAAGVLGQTVPRRGVPFTTDARHYCGAGIPTVVFGAGPASVFNNQGRIADEHLALDDLRKGTEAVALAVASYLSADEAFEETAQAGASPADTETKAGREARLPAPPERPEPSPMPPPAGTGAPAAARARSTATGPRIGIVGGARPGRTR